jgi:hypothetical protein
VIRGRRIPLRRKHMSKDRLFSFAELKPVLGISFSRVHLGRLAQLEQLGSSREIFARRWVNRIKHLHSGKG